MEINVEDCVIKEPTDLEIKDFLQNNKNPKLYLCKYGIYYNNKLIQLMVINRSDLKDYSYEIKINKVKNNYNILNGTETLWNHINKKIIIHSCVNRLKLNGSQSKELYKCGFILLKMEEEYIMSYFSGGIVYKITDENTGYFYIGSTHYKENFLNEKYSGSGYSNWVEYFNKYKDCHTFKREILKEKFKTEKEMYNYEVEEIRKYCIRLKNGNYKVDKDTKCLNKKTQPQGTPPICPECGGYLYIHFKTCSQYKRRMRPECGVVGTHNKTCSHYKAPDSCPECGKQRGHKKTCSHYIQPDPCPECGRTYGPHKKTCSYYVSNCTCEFCGTTNGHHKTTCPNFDESFICEECGAAYAHKSTCSHYVERDNCCEFCGTPPGGRHKKECPNFKPDPNACPYCGTPSGGRHKKECPNFKPIICKECGGRSGRHKLGCSKYKPVICSECGGKSNQHKSTCSKYRVSTVVCPKCGGKKNSHKKGCPDYKGRWKDHK